MPALITIAEAQQSVLGATGRLPTETVAIEHALDRVLAQEIRAAADVPSFESSAMDGYAIRAGAADRGLAVIGESRAGAPFDGSVGDGEAVRISTGAAVPDGADAVIPQEDTATDHNRLTIGRSTAPGANIRAPGEDVEGGALVLRPGTPLRAAELGAAVAAGVGEVAVVRRPRVAVLCTGDELRAPGEPLGPGQIHNSNAPMLSALATRCGALAPPAARLRDSLDATRDALEGAIAGSDVVLLTGGVSVGPHDHVKPALAALGVQQRFWGIAMRPGKPTWFGTKEGTLVFGLPGNPVSAVVTFSLFARLALATLQGGEALPLLGERAELTEPIRSHPSREQAILARVERRDGVTLARPLSRQRSHIVTALLGADALVLVPIGEGELPAGAGVRLAELVR